MNALVPLLLVLVALAVGFLPLFFLVSWIWWQRRCDARRSPLTDELTHLPGEQAQREADRLMDIADERMLIAVLIGPMILAAWALQKLGARSFHFGITEAAFLILVLIVGVWATWSASKATPQGQSRISCWRGASGGRFLGRPTFFGPILRPSCCSIIRRKRSGP